MDTPVPPLPPQPVPQPSAPPVMPEPHPASSLRWLWVGLIILVILAGAAYAWLRLFPSTPIVQPTVSPSASPGVSPTQSPVAGWKTFTDAMNGFSFQYPASISAQYISASVWPPTMLVTTGVFSCVEDQFTSIKTINTHQYCVVTHSSGAAGTIYNDYSYLKAEGTKLLQTSFTLGYSQCANYDAAGMAACQQERTTFSADSLADQIVSTYRAAP